MESKGALKQRLIAEGRWEAFVARREALKAQGIEPKKAWEQAKHELDEGDNKKPQDNQAGSSGCGDNIADGGNNKPLPPAKPSDSSVKSKRASITKDFEWVYWHIGDSNTSPEDAPSSSAWWMLERVRNNPTVQIEFIRTLLQRLRPDKNETQSERFYDDGREQINLIERVRAASKNSVL